MLPLTGIHVVELATVLAGPEVGRFLSELGATVTKYEAPSGDVTRGWKLQQEDSHSSISAYFAAINAGKSYAQIDLKTEAGVKLLRDLLQNADILLTNFKQGDEEKFGLNSEELKTSFPKLIWGKIGGFRTDPSRPAFDVVLQAETGWMSMTGLPESSPVKMPVALIDVIAAHQLKEALLIALLEREKWGMGSHWEVTLEEASLSALTNQATNFWMNDVIAQPMGTAHPNIAPYGDLLATADEKWAVPAIGSHAQFQSFCALLNIPELASDRRFRSNVDRVSHRSELVKALNCETVKWNSAELSSECVRLKIPLGIVKNLGEVLSQPTAQSLSIHETIENRQTQRVKSFVAKRL